MAKNYGAYTICVNTLKLQTPEKYKQAIDCYIERYNFGRDFGSFKAGFSHLYKRQWHDKCPRLLMLNDSLFYSKKHLARFISDLFETDVEVLGATENHEVEHHLGSFCLSLDGRIVRHYKFRAYWKRYSSSDVRPVVIKRGEMGLSKTLRRCVSSLDQYSAFFDLSWFSEQVAKNPELLETISDFYRAADFHRASDFVDWKRPSLKAAAERILSRYTINDPGLEDKYASV